METTVALQQKLADDDDTAYILHYFFPVIGAFMNFFNVKDEATVVENTQTILTYFADSRGGATPRFNRKFAKNADYTLNKIGYTRSTYWLHQIGAAFDYAWILFAWNPIVWLLGPLEWISSWAINPAVHFTYLYGMDSSNYI